MIEILLALNVGITVAAYFLGKDIFTRLKTLEANMIGSATVENNLEHRLAIVEYSIEQLENTKKITTKK